jgi:hypothetical protein
MDISSGDISDYIFKRIVRDDIGNFSLDSNMLAVLMELDGSKRLDQVAQKVGINLGTMRDVIARLLELKLIEPISQAVSVIDKDFYNYLLDQLSMAIGPIAEVLIEDQITDMGYNQSQFPAHRAAELIDLLSRDIQRDEKKVVFKQNMVEKLREKKY